MKKLISLVLALAMIMMVGAVYAADGDLTVDAKVTVSGFENGDTTIYDERATEVINYFKAKFNAKKGTVDLDAANNYFNLLKKRRLIKMTMF